MFFSDQIKGNMLTGKRTLTTLACLLSGTATVWAKGATGPAPEDSLSSPMAITLLIIILALALILALLAWVVNGAAGVFIGKLRASSTAHTPKVLLPLGLLLLSASAMAQDSTTVATTVPSAIGGLDPTTFYILLGVIGIELIGILYLLYNLQLLIRAEKERLRSSAEASGLKLAPSVSLWSKLNSFRPVEQEADIDLGHNYDGIRELDNRLPPWWLYGFYLTIIFGAIYLWRFHVSHTGPSSQEEYATAMNKAALAQEEYLKKAANKVDETSVVLLDAAGIEKGKVNFLATCAACHGKLGEGGVGPNLTDDYWIHGGKINDVFKTIKYGYPEKGMRSWKDDYSPVKIAELASFIKSLHGTNPPNAKAQQGDLYKESAAGTDSSAVAPGDSTKPATTDTTAVKQVAK